MRLREQVWWISATVLSLAAFSFFAGYGIRGLFDGLRTGRSTLSLPYPRVASAAPKGLDPDVRPQTLYFEVLKRLQLYYVEPLPSNDTLALGSVDAMLNSLNDPNTRLVSKQEVEAMKSEAVGEYPGIGAVLMVKRQTGRLEDAVAEEDQHVTGQLPSKPGKVAAPAAPVNPGTRTITVVSVAPGGPAAKADIRSGDRITEIDGHWIAPAHVSYRLLTQLTDSLGPQDLRPRDPNEPIEKIPPDPARDRARKREEEFRNRWKNATELPIVMQQLQGGAQGEHELTVERGHPTQTLHVKLTLGTTKVDAFSSRDLNDSTGYVRILAFNPTTPKSVADALAELQKHRKKQLVLDLRESAGGSLEAARDVAALLLGDARFAVLKEHDADRKMVEHPISAHKGTAPVMKLTRLSVLVDGGTAGTSELLAAALRDHLGAVLVGTTTFGDGTEQELMTLDNGAGLTITRARMLTDKALEYDGHGLKPDLPALGDPLDAAVKALSSAKPIGGRTGA